MLPRVSPADSFHKRRGLVKGPARMFNFEEEALLNAQSFNLSKGGLIIIVKIMIIFLII
jgi:hypothetical protein